MPTTETDGTSILYRIDGPGRGPVVMLSGSLASDLTMWDAQIPALTEAGYHTSKMYSKWICHSSTRSIARGSDNV